MDKLDMPTMATMGLDKLTCKRILGLKTGPGPYTFSLPNRSEERCSHGLKLGGFDFACDDSDEDWSENKEIEVNTSQHKSI